MVSQLGPAIDVRRTFRHERDLLIQLQRSSENRIGRREQPVPAGLCVKLPRTCYTTTFAGTLALATRLTSLLW